MKRMIRLAVCAALCLSLLAAGLCTASSAAGFFSKAEMLYIDGNVEAGAGLNEYATVQGACVGGDYAYFGFMQGGVCTLAKYSARTWEYITQEQIINMGHSNDMTYNSDKGYLVVANNAPYYNVVTLINPDTLAPIKDVEIKEDIYSIAYNAKRKAYVVGLSGTYDFALLDSDFKVTKKFEGVQTGYTRQGCDCDDNYIYFIQSGASNLLVIYDYSGKLVAQIPLGESYEAENIFHVGSAFYASMYYYGAKLYRIGFSDATKITYNVIYDANGGEGEMKQTTVHYGEDTPLSPCAFTREGYFFAGWKAQRTCDGRYIGYANGAKEFDWHDEGDVFNYVLYDDQEHVAATVQYGDVKMYAMWFSQQYDITFDSGEGEGEAQTCTVGHSEALTVPDLGFTREGYVFDGFLLTRDADGRTYGYRSGSDMAEWLYPEDVDKPYLAKIGDQVHSLTPEGGVTMTAQYKFAYTFGEDGSTLVEYVGVDEEVSIPSNDGELKTLGEGAIKDNENVKDLYIPAGVDSLRKQAISNCPKLRSIYFEGELPEKIDGESFVGKDAPVIYEIRDGQAFCVGFFSGKQSIPLLRLHSEQLERFRSEK